MKKYFVIFLIVVFSVTALFSQDKGEKKPLFGIKFSGFVKTDIFFDSRQTVAAREGHFLLYPENEKLDADGKDIRVTGRSGLASDVCHGLCSGHCFVQYRRPFCGLLPQSASPDHTAGR